MCVDIYIYFLHIDALYYLYYLIGIPSNAISLRGSNQWQNRAQVIFITEKSTGHRYRQFIETIQTSGRRQSEDTASP